MKVEKIIENLKADPRNKTYTKRGIGPIFQFNKNAKKMLKF